MKRFFCFLLAFLLIVPSAFAIDLETFNMYAEFFGGHEIKTPGISNESDIGELTSYDLDDCNILFLETDGKLKSITVEGSGDFFLTYSAAAIITIEGSHENVTDIFGKLLYNYFEAHRKEENDITLCTTSAGRLFKVVPKGTGYKMMVMVR